MFLTRYIALSDPPPKNCPFLLGLPTPTGKNRPLAHPTHHSKRHNWRIYTELLLLLGMFEKFARTYHISMWTSMYTQHTTSAMLNFPI